MADLIPTDGDFGLFRCFRVGPLSKKSGAVDLTALVSRYVWGPGPRAAECPRGHSAEPVDAPEWKSSRPDRIPVLGCNCGFWGFKGFKEMVRQEGMGNDRVYGLVGMWGRCVEHQTGMRAEFAEIVCFIEPLRPEHLKSFPREGLALGFPNVPIVRLAEVKVVIADLGLTLLQKSPTPPALQWLTPEGELVWLQEPHKPREEWAVRLPIAAKHCGEATTVEVDGPSPIVYRLRKSRYQHDNKVYVYWERVASTHTAKVFREF